ncbi:hypothetical protein [Candidatus Nitronereus thalassa]|uniref:Uncharacterized protein n=1 Tax=Candidatus Nitronereus thalassa TaxID=3020898 RepID=A0ABU3K4G1_9BACT|nr:hypothetical protein [Candidatus Nitronereus thalassa]MDT7041243.1 hypothetical protein [Candidatus Nitronereus thalassa]
MMTACNIAYGGHGATNVLRQNLGQLTEAADIILVGKVIEMTDGLAENNLPYTEITFEVSQTIKSGGYQFVTSPNWERRNTTALPGRQTFTYRQFGLLKPRDMGDGKTLAVTLDGFPKYTIDEEVMVFLYKPATQTGFRTTVGLAQGKFSIKKGKMRNIINNRHLFANMEIERENLQASERQMMTQRSGPVDADMMITLVSRAVKEGLFNRFKVAPE